MATKVPLIFTSLQNYKNFANEFSETKKYKNIKNYKNIESNLLKSFERWSGKANYSDLNLRRTGPFLSKEEKDIGKKVGKRIKSNYSYDGIVELVDIFPTLADLAGIKKVEKCSTIMEKCNERKKSNERKKEKCNERKKSALPQVYKHQNLAIDREIILCTEGRSLSKIIIDNPTAKNMHPKSLQTFSNRKCRRNALRGKIAISQYPRPSLIPSQDPDSDQPRLEETIVMGYSMRSLCYRLTLWVPFNHSTFKPNFSRVYAEELYDHRFDPEENHNVVWLHRSWAHKRKKMLKHLHNKKETHYF